jgi:hypothetical protein
VCDSNGSAVGSAFLYSSNKYTSQTVTTGQEYYIRIRPDSSNSGTYQIGFNTSLSAPVNLPTTGVTQLTLNKMADGNIPTSSDVQWFKFNATASTQYIHVDFDGIPSNLYVQVYDSSGVPVGNEDYLYRSSSNNYISRTVTNGQEYYIRIRPYRSSEIGTYQIGFNTSTTKPIITLPTTGVTQLTLNTWEDGNLPKSGDVQWFKFTATASLQYIHVRFGTLIELYVQVYDSNGSVVGSENILNNTNTIIGTTSRTVTTGEEYYIRIKPYFSSGKGTYEIGFTTSTTRPPN